MAAHYHNGASGPNGNDRGDHHSSGGVHDADAIRARMDQLRLGLPNDLDALSRNAREAVDWKHYVRNHPIACLGVAALAGYALVPSKRHTLSMTDAQLERLARKGALKVTPTHTSSGGVASKALAVLGTFAARAAMAYVGERMGASAVDHPPEE